MSSSVLPQQHQQSNDDNDNDNDETDTKMAPPRKLNDTTTMPPPPVDQSSTAEEQEDRKMNDSTMPPPPVVQSPKATNSTLVSTSTSSSSCIPNNATAKKTIPSSSTTVTAAVPTAAIAPRVRQKVVPRSKKGFGLSDWNRLLSVSKDLAQRHGQGIRRRIPWKEIRQHNTIHDGWMVLKQKVYFISPYLAYHPGGERILKPVLGKDGTALFEKYHRWINEEPLIGKLLLGYLDTSSREDSDDEDDEEEQRRKNNYLPTNM